MKRFRASGLLQRGVAAVEAALLMVPLMILLYGIAEGGFLVFQYNTITKSTRDAARYLSTVPAGAGHATATCLAVYGNTGCSGDPLVPGLAAGNVQICDASNCPGTHRNVPATGNGGAATGVMNLVTVTIDDYHPDNLVNALMSWVELGPVSTTMRQAL
jgi:Flp pilus assembly protein TadG